MGNDNKITFLVSKVPGWTVATKEGNSAFLNVGDKIEASKVIDAVVNSLEEGRPEYANLGNLVQLDVAELGDPGAEERLKQLARVQGTEVVGAEDDEDGDLDPGGAPTEGEGDPEIVGGGEGEADLDDKREGAGGALFDPSEHKVEEVLTYLATVKDGAGEVERVKGLEAASSRGSTQVAAFEAGAGS